jgi:hypothetical protein
VDTGGDRPIFIVGCPRSGTTLLQLMLHAHPRIAIPPETRFLMAAYADRKRFGDLGSEPNRRRLAEWIVDGKFAFRDLGLDRQAVVDEIAAGPPTLGSAIGIVFRAYARRFGKPRWGDKRPAYLLNLDVVLDLFPDAQIVHIIRDGRDCVASLIEAPWHRGGIHQAIAGWNAGMDGARRAARRLGPDTYYELYYEQLVAHPTIELEKLCGFLGEEFAPAMASPAEAAGIAVPKRKTWHALTHGDVTTSRVGSWAGRLDDAQVGLCETLMRDRLEAHGYEVSGRRAATVGQLLRYARFGVRARLSRVKHRLHQGHAELAAQLTSRERENL